MNLNEWRDKCWDLAERKGFHEERECSRDDTLVRLCLIHSEVSEVVQVVKREWVDGDLQSQITFGKFGEEIADVFIRLFDLAGCCGLDIEYFVKAKMNKNELRNKYYGTPLEGNSLKE